MTIHDEASGRTFKTNGVWADEETLLLEGPRGTWTLFTNAVGGLEVAFLLVGEG